MGKFRERACGFLPGAKLMGAQAMGVEATIHRWAAGVISSRCSCAGRGQCRGVSEQDGGDQIPSSSAQ